MNISIAKSLDEISDCFPVILQLRTTLTRKKFIDKVRKQQENGYHLAFVKDQGKVMAVSGFRISQSLAWGKFLYIDDLITDQDNRSKGYGDKLFDFLVEYALKENCHELHLDSGVQRFGAHRFYMKKNMAIVAHHFSLSLDNN